MDNVVELKQPDGVLYDTKPTQFEEVRELILGKPELVCINNGEVAERSIAVGC